MFCKHVYGIIHQFVYTMSTAVQKTRQSMYGLREFTACMSNYSAVYLQFHRASWYYHVFYLSNWMYNYIVKKNVKIYIKIYIKIYMKMLLHVSV
jgi:hypothetical protein